MGKGINIVVATRFCTSCQQARYKNEGVWHVFNRNLNRRWVCNWCLKRRQQHAATQIEAGR